ncbi:hypothetical protein ACPPVQ_18845 [Diaminobutyricibacter sp. McL0618]|uniref:hypothetical protein n=1 Tax=Leifsonia sp. McL0618 TaxID=3415677 RepID=UPI003CF216F1
MLAEEMKVETPLALAELEDRTIYSGHEYENQCSDCGVTEADPWYPIEDIMLVRHWTKTSEPEGGTWWWYCPDHFDRRGDRWWANSHLAPAELLPEEKHFCARYIGLNSVCGSPAIEPFDGVWVCETHAVTERVNRRIAELLS